ncbi:MAG: hypothetical protein Q9195_004086 [Heterodermia aff. obscurata]
MATQYDSYDISRLKDFALGLAQQEHLSEHEDQGDQDVSLASTAAGNKQLPDTGTDSAAPTKRQNAIKVPLKGISNSQADGDESKQHPVNLPQDPGLNGLNAYEKASATPSQPPSTIPDSVAARMAATASQSEGDTQPLSQGAREQCAREIRQHHAERQSEATSENISNWITRSHSYQPGETGYINIVEGLEQPIASGILEAAEIQDDDIDPDSQMADVRVEIFPESRRFQQPITPATTSRKRRRVGSPLNHENTTPMLPINPFAGQAGGLDGMMNASQAFKATQFTSPLPNALISDGLSERPSPDVFNAGRPSTSDPISSPVCLQRSRMTRAVTEPRATYISMAESQAERDRQEKLNEIAQAKLYQDVSDDDFDSEGSDIRRRRLRRKIDMESNKLFATVTAKARPGPSKRGRGGRKQETPRAASSRKYVKPDREAVIISDDPIADGNVTEDETEKEQDVTESEADSPDELSEENKENFDFKGLQLPMPASRAKSRETRGNTIQISSPHQRVRRSASTSPIQVIASSKACHTSPSSPEVASSTRPGLRGGYSTASTDHTEGIPTATATVAVADSQPTRETHSDPPSKASLKHSEVIESSPEQRVFISQSQVSRSPNHSPSHESAVINASSQQICVPESSRSPTVRRLNVQGNLLQPQSHSVDSENSSKDPSKSLQPPMPVEGIRNSPPQLQNASLEATSGRPSEEFASNLVVTAEPPRPDPTLSSNNDSRVIHSSKEQSKESSRPQDQHRTITTIPDTSSATMPGATSEPILMSSAPPASSNTSTRGESRIQSSLAHGVASGNSPVFETAPTHVNTSPSNPIAVDISPLPQKTILTPAQNKTMSKSMIEIATALSPPAAMNDLDMDINLMTADDIEYEAVMRGSSPIGPSRKRRRGRAGRIMHVEETESDGQPTPNVLAGQARSGISENVSSISMNKDQLHNNEVTSKVVETPRSLSPAPSVFKTPSSVDTPRRRGRPKKVSLPTDPLNEPKVTEVEEKRIPKRVSRAELPRIQTGTESQQAYEGGLGSALVAAPNQVFAHFNGTYAAFYPATCFGEVRGQDSQFKVRFDDGVEDVINGFGIKRLELRPGDNVKIQNGGNRKKNYVVIKMETKHQSAPTSHLRTSTSRNAPPRVSTATPILTDIRGYTHVVLSPKQTNTTEEQPNEILTVPISDVYFTQTMWTGLKDRSYKYTPLPSRHSGRMETPLERSSIPSTPSSRTQRMKTSGFGPSRSSKPLSTTTKSDLLENMVFAITNITDPTLRTTLNSLIINNGGQLLSEDFSELFHVPSLNPPSPSKRSPKRDTDSTFHLTPAASQKGFTCLLADKHCRMAKYIQALALGIPCLSSRWVQDCLTSHSILPWQPYLLAAGESTFLHGAIRSRILPPIDPLSATLADIVDARPRLLADANVLLIMERGEEDTMRSHPLLSHALGARKVSRAATMGDAARMLAEGDGEEGWDWVYSHDKEERVERGLFGRGSGVGKKRKRGGGEGEGRRTRVVGNEFVIQSLILGRLVEGG